MDKTPKEPGANRRTLLNAMEALKHPRVDVKDPQAIEQRITEYLNFCVEKDISPTLQGCSNWLGISITTLSAWYSGAKATPEHQLVAARFYAIVQDIWAQDMHEGDVNNIAGIFVGKAMFGYKDTQEIVVTSRSSNELTAADLIAESKMLPGGDNLIIDGEAKILEDLPIAEPQKELVEPKKKQGKMNTGKSYDTLTINDMQSQ